MASDSASTVPTLRTVTIPILITLGVTALRLYGERQHWSEFWFNPSVGGGMAPIGIVWLVPIFALMFALKLARAGLAPVRPGLTIGLFFLTLLVLPAVGFAGSLLEVTQVTSLGLFGIGSLVVMALSYGVWPALGRLLFAYGIGARIPVVMIMWQAIMNDWHTHYDVPPPNFPEMDKLPKFLWIGLMPQMTIWIAFTMVFGGLVAAIAVSFRKTSSAGEALAAK